MITLTQRKLEALNWQQWLDIWQAAVTIECAIQIVWNCGNIEQVATYYQFARAFDRLEKIST